MIRRSDDGLFDYGSKAGGLEYFHPAFASSADLGFPVFFFSEKILWLDQ